MRKHIIMSSILMLLLYTSCSSIVDRQESKKKDSITLDSSYVDVNTKNLQSKLVSEGWQLFNLSTGDITSKLNLTPQYGDMDNYLDVEVGSHTNAVLKLYECKTNECIRIAFIRHSSDFVIGRIPEGNYYLKIAYGCDWMMFKSDKKVIGKFTRNSHYIKSSDSFDFTIHQNADGYNTTNYKLELDVIENSCKNNFKYSEITENEFNN